VRLSAFAQNSRIGSNAGSPTATIARKALSFSSWSVIDGSIAKVKRFKSAAAASAFAIFDSASIASCRS
jgi:hypothetical protein